MWAVHGRHEVRSAGCPKKVSQGSLISTGCPDTPNPLPRRRSEYALRAGRNRPNLANIWAKICPSRADVDQIWSDSGRIRQISATFRRKRWPARGSSSQTPAPRPAKNNPASILRVFFSRRQQHAAGGNIGQNWATYCRQLSEFAPEVANIAKLGRNRYINYKNRPNRPISGQM